MANKQNLIELNPDRYGDRYMISESGKIYYNTKCWRNPKGKIKELTPSYNPSGYLYYKLSIGKCKYDYVRGHRIVWESFNGKIPNGLEIDHIDRNKHNNKLKNLRLVTHSENCLNRIKNK
jgi:hypothetical protein